MLSFFNLLEPAADCSDDFTFHKRPFDRQDSFHRHLDPMTDCEAASGGNNYYVVENIDPTNPIKLYSCFAPDGLCLRLNSATEYNVQTLLGNKLHVKLHYSTVSIFYIDCQIQIFVITKKIQLNIIRLVSA